jgi:hypothetical protein
MSTWNDTERRRVIQQIDFATVSLHQLRQDHSGDDLSWQKKSMWTELQDALADAKRFLIQLERSRGL